MADMTELTQDDAERIEKLLLGRRIVLAETGSFDTPRRWTKASGRLVLDDGTEVFVAPNEGGCSCGAGDYTLERLASVDNIITAVRLADETEGDSYEPDTKYRIYVVADAAEINVMSVEGNDGNGYYGTGYELFVKAPGRG